MHTDTQAYGDTDIQTYREIQRYGGTDIQAPRHTGTQMCREIYTRRHRDTGTERSRDPEILNTKLQGYRHTDIQHD